MCTCGEENVWFGKLRFLFLLSEDDVRLASSARDLQHALEQFVVECKASGMSQFLHV